MAKQKRKFLNAYKKAEAGYTPEDVKGDEIVIPGLAVSPEQALQRYGANTLLDNVKLWYDSEGLVMPDIDRMSPIERLQFTRENVLKIQELNAQLAAEQEAAETAATVEAAAGETAPSE